MANTIKLVGTYFGISDNAHAFDCPRLQSGVFWIGRKRDMSLPLGTRVEITLPADVVQLAPELTAEQIEARNAAAERRGNALLAKVAARRGVTPENARRENARKPRLRKTKPAATADTIDAE